jgi:acyl carrier protein
MPDSIKQSCVRIFRDAISEAHPINIEAWGAERLLAEPFETINVDSMTLLDFVMQVEDTYAIELDETAVSECRTLGEFAEIVAAAKDGKATAGA